MCRMAQGNTHTFALPDGIIRKAFVLANLDTFIIDEVSRANLCIEVGDLLAEEVAIVAFDEAHFHTLSSLGFGFETFVFQVFAHFLFGEITQREDKASEYLLWQSPKEIRLVFSHVIACHDVAVAFVFLQTAIVTGGNPCTIGLVCPFAK